MPLELTLLLPLDDFMTDNAFEDEASEEAIHFDGFGEVQVDYGGITNK